jgi:hypothetical protein
MNTEILGIHWRGDYYEGEPRGDLTDKEKQIIKALAGVDLSAVSISDLPVKALLSAEQVTVLKEHQTKLIKERRREEYKAKCDDLYFDGIAKALESGKKLGEISEEDLADWLKARGDTKRQHPIAVVEAVETVEVIKPVEK